MKRSLFVFTLAAAMLVAAPLAQATVIHLRADLSGLNKIPPNASPGTGFGIFTLDTAAQTLAIHIDFSGLTAPNTAAHIHCCLASPGVNSNQPVATTTPTFAGFPAGVSGVYDTVLDLTDPASYRAGFITSHGGIATAEADLIFGLQNQETYLNIHSGNFPGGEIRGILVPEPGTLTLLALGLCAGVASLRRKRA